MKRNLLVFVLIAAAMLLFTGLTYVGLRRARGVPASVAPRERPRIEAPRLERDIDLASGIGLDLWSTLPGRKIELLYQVMVLPWPKQVVPSVEVKTFHNGRDIYLYMEWADQTEDTAVDIGAFSDAAAIMFSLDDKAQPSSLMMGFMGSANIWHWKANRDREFWLGQKQEPIAYADFHYPFEEQELFVVSKDPVSSAASDLVTVRVGTITRKPVQSVEARGVYEGGVWRVVFRRTQKVSDPRIDARFDRSFPITIAFAVWNGSAGDRGGRKSISDWAELALR